MIRYLLNASRGLMGFTGSSPSHCLGFIHESVRGYFLGGGLANMDCSSPHEAYAAAQVKLAAGCLSYLELAVNQSTFPDLCEHWEPFFSYASSNFLRHTEIAFANGMVDHHVLERLYVQHASESLEHESGKRHPHKLFKPPPSFLYRLLESDCPGLARALLARPSNTMSCNNPQCSNDWAPCTHTSLSKPDLKVAYKELDLAIKRGRKDLVELLLDHGADVNMEVGSRNPVSTLRSGGITTILRRCSSVMAHVLVPRSS